MDIKPKVIGDATLHLGDSLAILPTLPDASIDLVVTSPRYNVRINYGELVDDNTDWGVYYGEMRQFLMQVHRLLCPGGVLALNVPKEVKLPHSDIERLGRRVEKIAMRLELMCEELGFLPRESIVWVKGKEETGPIANRYEMGSDNNVYIRSTCEMILLHSKARYHYDGGTGRRGKDDVPFLSEAKDVWWNVPGRANGHPAPFPLEIPHRLIRMYTCTRKRQPVVLDPFMGSGTAALAALALGRRFIGMEIEPTFFRLACNKIESATAQVTMDLPFPV